MTERDDAGTQRGRDARHPNDGDRDPLLVRPFVGGASAETWPSAAARPRRHVRSHRAAVSPIALPGRPGRSGASVPPDAGKGRRRLVVAGAGAAAVLILGTVGFVAMRSGGSDGTDLAARQTLPVVSPPAAAAGTPGPSVSPSAPGNTGPPGSGEPGGGDQPAPAPAGRASDTSTRANASAGRSGAGNAAPTLGAQVPQPVDRVGAIGSPGGLCLDLNGGVAADGNFIDVYRCNGTNAQIWTVSTDGTLRVAGKCAQSLAADTAIAVTGCDGRASTKWSAGANSSLVSVNIGQCLTDPRNGGSNGEAARLAACTGNANQRFTLP